jgi:hypothetical protein
LNNSAVLIRDKKTGNKEMTSYCEVKHGKVLYRVTSTYKGEIELGKALEDLTVKKVLRSASPLLNVEY